LAGIAWQGTFFATRITRFQTARLKLVSRIRKASHSEKSAIQNYFIRIMGLIWKALIQMKQESVETIYAERVMIQKLLVLITVRNPAYFSRVITSYI